MIHSRYFRRRSALSPSLPMTKGLPQIDGRPIYTSYLAFLQCTTRVFCLFVELKCTGSVTAAEDAVDGKVLRSGFLRWNSQLSPIQWTSVERQCYVVCRQSIELYKSETTTLLCLIVVNNTHCADMIACFIEKRTKFFFIGLIGNISDKNRPYGICRLILMMWSLFWSWRKLSCHVRYESTNTSLVMAQAFSFILTMLFCKTCVITFLVSSATITFPAWLQWRARFLFC